MENLKARWTSIVAGILIFGIVAWWSIWTIKHTAKKAEEEGRQLAEQAIRRAAVTCYAIEGAYPPNYEYLEQHYEVHIDQTRYIVFYQVFASNIMPDITVTQRKDCA